MQEIKTISLSLPYRLGTVNCYLAKAGTGYVLIDTGPSNQRVHLEKELADAGCQPDNLHLILLTHGDFDHSGNAAYLGQKFGAKVAMHPGDAGMVERGDMFWNRKSGNVVIRKLAPILFRFGKSSRFQADLYVEDGNDLSQYGFKAEVVSIPGHSQGSIGILTAGGDLFCGDLLDSTQQPVLNSIMDDPPAAEASVARLAGLEIKTVYPGHGRPFPMEEFMASRRHELDA